MYMYKTFVRWFLENSCVAIASSCNVTMFSYFHFILFHFEYLYIMTDTRNCLFASDGFIPETL